MEFNIIEVAGHRIAELISAGVVIKQPQDALEVIAEVSAQGAERVILYEQNLAPAFFDLKSLLAGEVLQKHSTYHVKVALVGAFEKYPSKSLQAFILESNRGNIVFFAPTRSEAIAYLTR